MGRLDNKVAVVTGAGMGIGQATALLMAREGARVAIGDINDEAGAATAQTITDAGGTAFFQHTDVGVSEQVQQLVDSTVERFGKLDVMVNNAAIALPNTAVSATEDDWNHVLNINLSSVWRGIKFAIPHMIKNGGGSIVSVSSVQSLMGFNGWAAYAAAKGGINGLTQQAAVDYSPHNIRINAVAPGTIMTPMNERIFEETEDADALIQSWNEAHALGRFGQPEEVAQLIVFLASDESSFITGDVIRVDGGMTIKGA